MFAISSNPSALSAVISFGTSQVYQIACWGFSLGVYPYERFEKTGFD